MTYFVVLPRTGPQSNLNSSYTGEEIAALGATLRDVPPQGR